tara:strand:- start:354 stop:548 length:195 start_codon:yes stop_codon:yes gene_type:complete
MKLIVLDFLKDICYVYNLNPTNATSGYIGEHVLDYDEPERVLHDLGHNPTHCLWMLTKNEIIIK